MSRLDPQDYPTESDGRISVGLQLMLGLFLMSAFVFIVWLMFGA